MDCEVAVGERVDRGRQVTDLLPYVVAAITLAIVVALGWLHRPIIGLGDDEEGSDE